MSETTSNDKDQDMTSNSNSTKPKATPSKTKTPLPAPPKFDPSSIKVTTSSGLGKGTGTSSSSGGSSSSITSRLNLPKPPPLPIKKTNAKIPTTSTSASVAGGATTSTSTPPIHSHNHNHNHSSKDGKKDSTDANSSPHETIQRIPKLQSAPNSGASININIKPPLASASASAKDTIDKTYNATTNIQKEMGVHHNNNTEKETDMDTDTDMGQLTIPKVPKRHHKYTQQPPQSLLTTSQRSIPILLIASPSAQSIADKNNLSLSQLLNGLGNSITRDPSAVMKLDPIRSVNRMISLKWDMVNLQFVETFGFGNGNGNGGGNGGGNNGKDVGVGDNDWEERLQYVSEIWPDEQDFSELEEKIEAIFQTNHDHENDNSKGGTNASTSTSTSSGRNHFQTSKNEKIKDGTSLMSHNKTPWYARFRHGINTQTSHQAFSLIHSPPVVLYVASSSEGVAGLEKLMDKKYFPEEYRNGLFDPKGMRDQFLILHDEKEKWQGQGQDGEDVSVGSGNSSVGFNEIKMVQQLRNRFGASSTAVVRMNSNVVTADQMQELKEDELWDEFLMPDTPKSQLEFTRDSHRIRGAFLSNKDKNSLRRFIAQMVTSIVIPAIEKRIYELNVEVTNHKKGVKNVFKSFWRKPRDGSSLNGSMHGSMTASYHGSEGGNTSASGINDVPYRYDSIESQTRLMADTLFLIRDYEGALGMYKLVRDDYKHDHKLMHNGSAHEMMAMCVYLSDLTTGYRSTREIIQYIDSALYLYTSAAEEDRLNKGGTRPAIASIATRCVTRLCLFLSSARLLCTDRDMETADSLAAASSKETPLGAAVLLEQSSGHYHRAGMDRKFAFHMLMAGHMFRSAGQEHHAVRCFASAMHVYHAGDRFWAELFNHLSSALAGQLYGMKRMQLSLQLYAKLVGTTGGGRVSVRSQQKFLDHLVAICRGHENDALESTKRMKLASFGSDTSHYDEAEEVLRCTPKTTRRLEIPNMNLPKIFDSTIKVTTTSLSSSLKASPADHATFGNPSEGSELVWQDMMCSSQAELRASIKSAPHQPLQYSSEEFTNKVIEEIDEEKSNLQVKSRMKKTSNTESPAVRAKLEPITVSFEVSNPLSVLVPISSMQLVARLVCSKSHRVYSNVEALDIATDASETKPPKKWKFSGSEKLFEVPHFARVSPNSDNGDNIWHSGIAKNVDPFFLVSKGMIAMEARSKSTISLELCPLVMGELEIVGVRCKIFNEIWVYHKFQVLGSLLQNNVFNRANRIRSVPYLLHSKIEQNMPSISVEVIQNEELSNNGVVLQGQVSRWILRVSNQGAAHATNLCLKLNVPWFNFLSCDGTLLPEDRETSHCLGPSGTMMRLPLHSNCGTTGQADTLSPGQTVDIPIEIRTSGGGRQEFYMLFRYELFEKATASKPPPTNPKCRWLRKMVSVAVFPSLTLTASLTPSFSNKKDSILSVEVCYIFSYLLHELNTSSNHHLIKIPASFPTDDKLPQRQGD